MGNYQESPLRNRLQAVLGGGPLGAGAIVGLLLITGGTLMFIDNLALLPFDVTEAFWPIIFIAVSGYGLLRTESLAVKVWCVTGLVAGILLLLGNFHVIHANSDIIWPLILIASGIVMLIYRLRWRDITDKLNIGVHVGSNVRGKLSANRLHEIAVFSGIKRRVEASAFEGGDLNAFFGSIQLDLRQDAFTTAGRIVGLDANAMFGGIEIRIPETWKLSLQGAAVFGTYEDKTIPMRPEPGVEIPTLVVRGGTMFGSVVVRN